MKGMHVIGCIRNTNGLCLPQGFQRPPPVRPSEQTAGSGHCHRKCLQKQRRKRQLRHAQIQQITQREKGTCVNAPLK